MLWLWNLSWSEVVFLLRSGWDDLVQTDFWQIRYTDSNLALYAGAVVAGVVLLKLFFIRYGRKKYSQKVSGHFISGYFRRGILAKTVFSFPKLGLSVFFLATLFAIANPFLPITRDEKKYVETRVRVDARDVSGSMAGAFRGSDKAKAEIASDAHLKFLEMRAGKGDRASYWVFSNGPYLIQGFTVDEEVYYQQVYDSPWELGSQQVEAFPPDYWKNYKIPKSRYSFVAGEGGTMMSPLLRAIVDQFEEDDRKQNKSPFYRVVGRSALILTDAEIHDLDNARVYIDKLRKKKVILYVILIGDVSSPGPPVGDEPVNDINPLLQEIEKNGGRFFPVSNADSLLQAYREIDRLEKTKIEIQKKVYKIPLFYKFIYIAILALIIIIPAGLFFQIWMYP